MRSSLHYAAVLPCRILTSFLSPLVPFILTWRKDYKVKSWLRSDIIAGFTIAFMGIPQGLAYAKLANVDTVYGTWGCLVCASALPLPLPLPHTHPSWDVGAD